MSTSYEGVPPDERPGRTEAPRTTRDVDAGAGSGSTSGTSTARLDPPIDRQTVVAREKDAFGGVKIGSAFFGWLAATGMAVLLTALIAGAGTALGLGANVNTTAPTANDVQTVGIVGGIVLLVIVFVAYLCGGFVAGRMSRFNGVRQGVAV